MEAGNKEGLLTGAYRIGVVDPLTLEPVSGSSGSSGLVLSTTQVSGELGLRLWISFAHSKALGGLISRVFCKVKKILFLLQGYTGVGEIPFPPSSLQFCNFCVWSQQGIARSLDAPRSP